MPYVELFSQTAFSFLRGVSTPEELVEAAHRLGYPKLGIADRNGLYGVVRAHRRAKELGLSLIVGAELAHDLGAPTAGPDRPRLVLLAADRDGYRRLVRLLAKGRLAAGKGGFRLEPSALAEVGGGGLFAIHLGALDPFLLLRERELFGDRLSIGITRTRDPADDLHLEAARSASARLQVPLVAVGAVRFHDKALKPLLDILTCVRLGLRLDVAGRRLEKNAERVLLSPAAAARRFAGLEAAVARAEEIAATCHFRLDELTHRFTSELIPAGLTATEYLRRLVDKGVAERYPSGPPDDVTRQLTHELSIIETLGYEGYFLTVWDIVRFARSRGILCQGRGSAANSIVCYVLGITSIDPVRMSLLFERFVSVERGEPPDIDVDFEHDRREEVMQYVYRKYGRDHAALVATVITYRSRSAFREVGKVFGLSLEQVDRLSALSGSLLVADDSAPAIPDPDPNHAYSPTTRASRDDLRSAGLDPDSPAVAQTIRWARALVGRPRHLGQHTGGFVISREPLLDIVPIENATMVDRTVLAWDKDDLDTLGFFKIDLLSLGMLSAIRRTFALVAAFEKTELSLATIPAEDPKVYAMIADADTIGTFQVESRAQMQVLPKLAPRTFYDLVVSVAIIRPGPIQGDMVHPYLRRRRGEEPVEYPHPALETILGKTYGVPLFQEQVMKMAIAVAGFSGGEADELRRAIGWRSKIHIDRLRARLVSGMLARGITEAYAERIFRMIQGFGGYGFPESHAASFALIAYASCYLKRYHPAAFLAGLLNSQPMGFYSPNSLVKDAERHGLEVRPVSVLRSTFDATLEAPDATVQREGWRARALDGRTRHTPFADALAGEGRGLAIQPAVRLGLRSIRGMSEAVAARIVAARAVLPFASIADVALRAELPRDLAALLAEAGAFAELDPHRRRAMWRAHSVETKSLFAGHELRGLEALPLPEMVPAERLAADYRTTGLSVDGHPMQLLGGAARREGILGFRDLARLPSGAKVSVGGLVVTRQRPGTASGVVFITLEDEDGHMNLVVFPQVFDRCRRVATEAALLVADGRVEHDHGVTNVIVERLRPLPGAATEPKGRYHRFFRAM